MRRFVLNRHIDITGLSGTGIVAEGVQFGDGTVAVRWREMGPKHPSYLIGVRPTTTLYPDISVVEALHGHGGNTEIVWTD